MLARLGPLRQRRPSRGNLAGIAALVLLAGAVGAALCVTYTGRLQREAAAQRAIDVDCLARNVYYESRGEPLVGQYAVAEVTMNRVTSPLFPDTVCEVVHEARWDARRERYVGGFSWTELELREPYGYEWRRAQAVAGTVYDNYLEAPLVDGALFYHATRVSPDWAAAKIPIARIGRHLFYE